MLIWHDTQRRKMATPRWLQGAPQLARRHTAEGDVLAVGPHAAELLDYQPRAAWIALADGWRVCCKGEPEPLALLRQVDWAMVVQVRDARGRLWLVPAILDPTGMPAVARSRRWTDDGWVRDPVSELSHLAVEACQEARPVLEAGAWGEADLDHQQAWICTVLEAVYHLDTGTLGRLGLVDDVLAFQGLRMACGLLTAEDA